MKRILTTALFVTALTASATAAEPLKIEGRTTEPAITAAIHKQYPISATTVDIKHLATPANMQFTFEAKDQTVILTGVSLNIPDEVLTVHKTPENDILFTTKREVTYRILSATIGIELQKMQLGKNWITGKELYVGIMPTTSTSGNIQASGAIIRPSPGS